MSRGTEDLINELEQIMDEFTYISTYEEKQMSTHYMQIGEQEYDNMKDIIQLLKERIQ